MPRSLGGRLAFALLLFLVFALIAVLVAGDWPPLRRLDLAVTAAQHELALQHPAWVRFQVVWSFVFSPTGFRLAALAVAVWLYRRGAKRQVVWLVTTMTVGGLLGVLLKLLVGRNRPDLLDPVAQATGYSFPSGHALNAALGAGALLLVFLPFLRGRTGALVALWAAVVAIPFLTGATRVGLGVHYTSDVVAGWLLGVAVLAATTVAFWPRLKEEQVEQQEEAEQAAARA